MQATTQSISRATGLAKWENNSTAAIQRRKVLELVAKKQEDHAESLHRRRQKLSLLLRADKAELEERYKASLETPDQTRERMAKRAYELKSRRENERQMEAERCLLQQARLAQDEMRLEESKLRTIKVVKDQLRQIDDKEKEARHRRREDEEFAREWAASAEQKKEREEREVLELTKRNEHTRNVLDLQVHEQEIRKQRETEELEATRSSWRSQWKAEEDEEREMAARKIEENRDARVEIQSANFRYSLAKEEEKVREQELDKYLLREQQEKDRLADEGKRAERIAVSRASKEFNQHLKEMAIKEKADEGLLEHARLEEQEKEWRKRETRWKKENDARDALMSEVDRTRRAQIDHRRRLAEEDQMKDKAYIQRKKIEDEQLEERIRAQMEEEKQRRKLNSMLLQEQISEKERLQAIDRQREILIDKRAARYTEEFQKKVAAMREQVLANDQILEPGFHKKSFSSN